MSACNCSVDDGSAARASAVSVVRIRKNGQSRYEFPNIVCYCTVAEPCLLRHLVQPAPALEASLAADFTAAQVPAAMQLTLTPNVDIDLEFHFARDNVDRDSNDLGTYKLVGPKQRLEMLAKVGVSSNEQGELDVSGKLSPVAPLTIPDEMRPPVGVPVGATHFAFAYPAMSGGDSLEHVLEQLNLADERWAFFLLVGGFCYFTEDDTGRFKLMQCNALVLVPSDFTMEFDGPHTPDPAALQVLKKRSRIVDVTLDVLEDAGFAAFGWVLPDELPGGSKVCQGGSNAIDYPHGGFLYEMIDAEPTFFALQAPSEEAIKAYNANLAAKNNQGGRFSIKRMASNVRRDYAEAKAEQKEMNRMSAASDDPKMRGWGAFVRMQALPYMAPFLFPLGCVVSLASLAYHNRSLMEVAATALWYTCFVYSAWIPIRDTAAMSVLEGSRCDQLKMLGLLVSIPLLITLIFSASITVVESGAADYYVSLYLSSADGNGTIHDEYAQPCSHSSPHSHPIPKPPFPSGSLALHPGSCTPAPAPIPPLHRSDGRYVPLRENFDLTIEFLGLVLTYLAVPMFLYYLRVRVSNNLQKSGKGGKVEKTMLARSATTRMISMDSPSPAPPKEVSDNVVPFKNDSPPSESPQMHHSTAPAPSALLTAALGVIGDAVHTVTDVVEDVVEDVAETVLDETLPHHERHHSQRKSPRRSPRDRSKMSLSFSGTSLTNPWDGGKLLTPRTPRGTAVAKKRAVHPLEPKNPEKYETWSKVVQRRAAMRLQAVCRMRVSRRKYLAELERRRAWLRRFHWPVFLASLLDIIGANLIVALVKQGWLPEEWNLYSLLFTLPSFVVVLRDQKSENPPRFSLAHGIFFVAVLYRMANRAGQIDTYIFNVLNDLVMENAPSYISLVATATMVGHFAIFILVTALGKLSLSLVSTKNASLHLLFPFQVFDFLFLYSFFSIRAVKDPITAFYIANQIILQGNIICRNSGITDAFVRRQAKIFLPCILGKASLSKRDPNEDPIFRLQTIARLGIQYDLADRISLLLTPTVVTFFVWRDGFYTLQGSTILVQWCDVSRLWTYFGFLLCLKPFCSVIAQMILIRTMRKTMMGKTTIHGTSQIAAQIIADKKIKGGKKDGSSEFADAQEKIINEFGLGYEELLAVADDLSLTGINFRLLRIKQLRKWRFYSVVALLQTFLAFQVRTTAPVEHTEAATSAAFTSLGYNRTNWTVDSMVDLLAERRYIPVYKVPQQSVWLYVDGTFNHLASVPKLQAEIASRDQEIQASGVCYYDGWRVDGGPSEFGTLSDDVLEYLGEQVS